MISRKPLFWFLLILVSYLSLKPSSSVQEEIWLPSAWGLWLDIHDNWKNTLGFGTLALSAYFAWPGGWGPRQLASAWRRFLIAGALLALIMLFEFLQIFMPGRHADPADLTAGGLGIALAWVAGGKFRRGPR